MAEAVQFAVFWCLSTACFSWRSGVMYEERQRSAMFKNLANDTALHGHLLKQEIVQSEIHCIHKCVMNSQCQSINYEQCTSGSNLCELNKETRLSKPNNFVKRLGFAYYGWEEPCAIYSPCMNGGTCLPAVNKTAALYTCKCAIGYSGQNCETYQGFHFKFSDVTAKERASLTLSKEMESFTVLLWIAAAAVGKGKKSTLFSYATQRQPYLAALKFDDEGTIELVINGTTRNIPYVPLSDNVWHHVGITWENRAGNYTLYYDGNNIGSGTGLHPGLKLEAQGVLTLGQSQGATRGTFVSSEAYLGKLSSFNIWDYIFPEEKIRAASTSVKCESTDGDIAAWPDFAEGNNYFVSSNYWNIPTDCNPIDDASNYDVEFPRRHNVDYVIMQAVPSLTAFTASYYVSYTDSADQTFLSYATRSHQNEIFFLQRGGKFHIWITSAHKYHNIGVPNDGKWHNFVVTWKSVSGRYNIFLDGVKKASGTIATGRTIQGNGKIALGNDQDSYGGGWVAADAFVGKISRVNIWNMVFSSNTVKKLSRHCGKESGNAVLWKQFSQGTFKGQAGLNRPSSCVIM